MKNALFCVLFMLFLLQPYSSIKDFYTVSEYLFKNPPIIIENWVKSVNLIEVRLEELNLIAKYDRKETIDI